MYRDSTIALITARRRAGPALRWLAVAILLFAQLSFANHFHEADDLNSHDCTVCSQLHTVKHNTAQSGSSFSITAASPVYEYSPQVLSGSRRSIRPPCRAPPAAA